jgi:AcrR family transcriptional regulator
MIDPMGSPTSPTTAARRRGRPSVIDRDRIIAAALDIAAEDGAAAVSMSSVAKRLGVALPGLYYHLRNVDELLGLVAEALLGELAVPDVRLRWDRWLMTFATGFRDLLRAQPILTRVPYLSVHQPFPAVMTDRALRVLIRAGFDPHTASLAFGELTRKVVDLVFAEQARAEETSHGHSPLKVLRDRARIAGREDTPSLHLFLDDVEDMPDVIDGIDDFLWEWNMRVEIGGLESLLQQ